MRDFFFEIKHFFEDVLFAPFDMIRQYQDQNWWVANTAVWIMIGILFVFLFYWIGQLHKFDKEGTERRDANAHSFFRQN